MLPDLLACLGVIVSFDMNDPLVYSPRTSHSSGGSEEKLLIQSPSHLPKSGEVGIGNQLGLDE